MAASKHIHFVSLMLAGFALWQWKTQVQRRRLQSEGAAPASSKAAVAEWEGEGGALKGTGSQLGPEPQKS